MTERSAREVLLAIEREATEAERERELDDAMSRVSAMSREQLEREVQEAGFDLDELYAAADAFYERWVSQDAAQEVPPAGEPVAAADFAPSSGTLPFGEEPAERVVPIGVARARRARRWTWAVAAGFVLVGMGAAAVERDAVVARLERPKLETHAPDRDVAGPVREHLPAAPLRIPARDTPVDRARRMRDYAEEICARRYYDTCLYALDQAKRDDPAGEGEERVKRMRVLVKERPGEFLPKGGGWFAWPK